MDKFKLDNFRQENPTRSFPAYKSLSAEEVARLRERLAEKLVLPRDCDGRTLVDTISAQSSIIDGVNAESSDFDLMNLLRSEKIHSRDKVFINWYRFDEIDEIVTSDLSSDFAYVWYPSSEDVDIFDSTCSWILSIRHDGVPSILRISSRR